MLKELISEFRASPFRKNILEHGGWDLCAGLYRYEDSRDRRAVWRRLEKIFLPGQKLRELNCGTGIDAVHLAEGVYQSWRLMHGQEL